MAVNGREERVRSRHSALDISRIDLSATGVDDREALQVEGAVVQGRLGLGGGMPADATIVGR